MKTLEVNFKNLILTPEMRGLTTFEQHKQMRHFVSETRKHSSYAAPPLDPWNSEKWVVSVVAIKHAYQNEINATMQLLSHKIMQVILGFPQAKKVIYHPDTSSALFTG